jgi:hypothetical protein
MRCGQVAVVDLCKSEVGEFDDHVRTVVFEEQVFRFDVTVCDVVVVAVQQCLGDLPKEGNYYDMELF